MEGPSDPPVNPKCRSVTTCRVWCSTCLADSPFTRTTRDGLPIDEPFYTFDYCTIYTSYCVEFKYRFLCKVKVEVQFNFPIEGFNTVYMEVEISLSLILLRFIIYENVDVSK